MLRRHRFREISIKGVGESKKTNNSVFLLVEDGRWKYVTCNFFFVFTFILAGLSQERFNHGLARLQIEAWHRYNQHKCLGSADARRATLADMVDCYHFVWLKAYFPRRTYNVATKYELRGKLPPIPSLEDARKGRNRPKWVMEVMQLVSLVAASWF